MKEQKAGVYVPLSALFLVSDKLGQTDWSQQKTETE